MASSVWEESKLFLLSYCFRSVHIQAWKYILLRGRCRYRRILNLYLPCSLMSLWFQTVFDPFVVNNNILVYFGDYREIFHFHSRYSVISIRICHCDKMAKHHVTTECSDSAYPLLLSCFVIFMPKLRQNLQPPKAFRNIEFFTQTASPYTSIICYFYVKFYHRSETSVLFILH